MAMIKVGWSENASAVWPDLPVHATECGLYYCVNRYTTRVVNGSVEETVGQTAATRSANSWQIEDQKNSGVQLKSPIPDDIGYTFGPSSVDRTDLQLGGKFNVSQNAVDSIGAHLKEIFSINATASNINGYALYGGPSASDYNPGIMQALYESADLNTTLTGLAISISNSIRANADHRLSGQHVVKGQRGDYITYIDIRWVWLILPIALLVTGHGFVALTILRTRNGQIAVWKSNALPILAYGSQVTQSLFLEGLKRSHLISEIEELAEQCSTQFCLPSSSKKKSEGACEGINGNEGNGEERREFLRSGD